MKYSARYIESGIDGFDELIIDFPNERLNEILENHKDLRVVVSVSDVEQFFKSRDGVRLSLLRRKYDNFTVRLYNPCDFFCIKEEIINEFAQLNMPFFFGIKASNFEQLYYLLELGAKQVYVTDELGFSMTRAKRVCDSFEAQVRVIPNVAQSSVEASPAHKKFYIRPEDIKYYEDVVDIFEFGGPVERQIILKKIYSKGAWNGDLQHLLYNFDKEFDSKAIIDGFGAVRKDCSHRCYTHGTCTVCDRMLSVAKVLSEKSSSN